MKSLKIDLINGENKGLCKLYHDNGQLESEINYKKAKPHGRVRFYFDNGILKSEANYNMGILHGIFKCYYQNE